LAEIEAVASDMCQRIEQDERPLPFLKPVSVLGAKVLAAGGEPKPREIRGATTFGSQTCEINLDPFPQWDEDVGHLKADLAGFRTTIIGVLAHEASHVRQWTIGRERTRHEHQRSDNASRVAQASGLYTDYIAYLSTPLEIAAHSTQLAVEIRETHGDRLSSKITFENAAKQCGLWDHMTDHPISRPTCVESGAREFAPTSRLLLSNGWWIYQRLNRHQAPWPDHIAGWLRLVGHLIWPEYRNNPTPNGNVCQRRDPKTPAPATSPRL
jgi:hypothetical protein